MLAPKSRLTVWLIGLATLVLLGGAAVTQRAGTARADMWSAGRKLEALVDGVDRTRAVLYGEQVEGAAFEEYEAALLDLSPDVMDDWVAYRQAFEERDAETRALGVALVEANRGSLRALRRGAHAADAKGSVEWERGLSAHIPSLMDCRNLANLAWVAAELKLEAGDSAAAVNVLLDSAQFGGDLVQSPSLIGELVGNAVLSATLQNALVDQGLLWRLPKPELVRLAAALRQLEARLAVRGLAREAELAQFARSVAKRDGKGGLFASELEPNLWRFGFSQTLWMEDLFDGAQSVREELAGIESQPWAAAKVKLDAVDARASDAESALFGHQASFEGAHRIAIANLRLVIGAAEQRAGLDTELLPDPFGGAMLVTETPDGVQLHSVGPNGHADAERYSLLFVTVPQ